MQENKPDSIQVQCYNLAEYSEIVQKLFQDGYRFDFVSNANYPTSFGTFYTCTMVLVKEAPVEAPEQPTAASEGAVEGQVPVVPKGRPKKV
jgi:hypothetical protein